MLVFHYPAIDLVAGIGGQPLASRDVINHLLRLAKTRVIKIDFK